MSALNPLFVGLELESLHFFVVAGVDNGSKEEKEKGGDKVAEFGGMGLFNDGVLELEFIRGSMIELAMGWFFLGGGGEFI